MKRSAMLATATACLLLAAPAFSAPVATKIPAVYKNCTNLNKKYPHGLGRANARDKTKSKSSEPVTNFKRSTRLYNVAMSYNKRLDADKDGVACEEA